MDIMTINGVIRILLLIKKVYVSEESNPNYPSFSALPKVKNGYHLYVTLHYKEGTRGVEITPIPEPSHTPTPEIHSVEVPISESIEEEFTEALATGVIRADNRGSEKFTETMGNPTTESLYGEVTATEYLLGYRLTKKVETKTLHIQFYNYLSWKVLI